jgi:hypothetical protein
MIVLTSVRHAVDSIHIFISEVLEENQEPDGSH